MIDLHCHMLPAVDDGARNLDDALALATAAVGNGIEKCVLTPHMHEGRYDNTAKSLKGHFDAFRDTLARHELDLQLGLAAEVRIGIEVLIWLEAGLVPFLGDYQGKPVLLLELPHGQIPPGSDKLTRRLIDQGIQPMIAHPERNKYVIRDLSAIYPFVEMGCLLQVTAGSVVGQFGPYARERAAELLERGWVTILATDAHSIDWRPPNLAEGRMAAAEIVGEAESWELVRHRPEQIAAMHFGGPGPGPSDTAGTEPPG